MTDRTMGAADNLRLEGLLYEEVITAAKQWFTELFSTPESMSQHQSDSDS